MFHIALYEPRIAPNTGNIIRLAANNNCQLHLIEPLGFDLDEKKLRRAGLDYHDLTNLTRHTNYDAFLKAVQGQRIIACTTKGSRLYDQVNYQKDDVLLFGSETAGLPESVHQSLDQELRVRIPMQANNRSLNLSNAVAIVSYEAWRQLQFLGGN
ncbi:MAG: tRNA (cytidine(34)-2'-O)-methyltransferase [Gammaproteobacteria bacterium]|nr:tRNA (cytidine(34)-2'-O)-methyltransferase [Gammaproteobacteria bacterium]